MFSWLNRIFSQQGCSDVHLGNESNENQSTSRQMSEVELEDDFYEKFGINEMNILVVANRKEKETLSRMTKCFSEIFGGGYHFFPGTAQMKTESSTIKNVDYFKDVLEGVILSQKAALEGYDVPPTLLIFDKCVGKDDSAYRKVITENRSLRFTTLTVVTDPNDIDQRLLNKMDMMIVCKDRNKQKMQSRCRSFWEKKFSKIVGYEKFSCCINNSLGSMKVSVINHEGIDMIKFGKNGPEFTNVCKFK